VRVQADFSLADSNTLALRSRARAYIRVDSVADIDEALHWADAEGLAILPLGEGSNIVLAGDLDLAVLQVVNRGRELLGHNDNAVLVRVQAGENWHQLVRWSLQQGYYGLENLALIPGTAGAAPIQNIGAYGVELDRFVQRVHGIHLESGEHFSLSAEACDFGYRDSVFKQTLRDQVILTAVDLRLSLEPAAQLSYPALATALEQRGLDKPSPAEIFDTVVAVRSARLPDPAQEPNAGSFFKNPVVDAARVESLMKQFPQLPQYDLPEGKRKIPAAWLIEQCGWKGRQINGVGVHPGHALVLVNYGANSGRELLSLAAAIQHSIEDRFSIQLEIEPRIYGTVAGSF